MIKQYPSIAAIRQDYVDRVRNGKADDRDNGSWYGGESAAATLRLSASGDTRLVPDAERLFSSLDLEIETPRRVFAPAVAGGFPCVPDALAGRPTAMRRVHYEADDRAPITILATTTSSGGINATTLARRGTVILSLVMALTRTRPVSLHQLTVLDGDEGETVFTAQINTTPLDLATACYVLTSAGFSRRLTYDLARDLNGFMGGWPRDYDYLKPERYYDRLIPRLGLDPKFTLIIPASHWNDELTMRPIDWINKQIKRFSAQADAD